MGDVILRVPVGSPSDVRLFDPTALPEIVGTATIQLDAFSTAATALVVDLAGSENVSAPPSLWIPRVIDWRAHAVNGMYPDTDLHAKLTTAINHLTAFRHKELFSRIQTPVERAGSVGTSNLWRFRCRTGYGARAIIVAGILGAPNVAGVDPYTRIAITEVGGATQNVDLRGGVGAVVPTDSPNEWTSTFGLAPITPGTAYEVVISAVDYARPISITCYEVSTGVFDQNTDYYTTLDVSAGGAIRDNNMQRWIEGLMRMLRQNGGTLLHWSLFDGASRTRSSATDINLIDNTSTGTPTATTPGWRLDTTYRRTYSRTDVPFEFAAYGSISSGSGTVKWVDTAGLVVATVTINSATPQWFTATANIAAGTPKIDPLYAGDGTHTLNVSAISAYEWEAA